MVPPPPSTVGATLMRPLTGSKISMRLARFFIIRLFCRTARGVRLESQRPRPAPPSSLCPTSSRAVQPRPPAPALAPRQRRRAPPPALPSGAAARRRDVERVDVCARRDGRGAGRERSGPAVRRVSPHGAMARLCVRRLPGAGGGLCPPAGAAAARLGASLAVELAAAGARARGTQLP